MCCLPDDKKCSMKCKDNLAFSLPFAASPGTQSPQKDGETEKERQKKRDRERERATSPLWFAEMRVNVMQHFLRERSSQRPSFSPVPVVMARNESNATAILPRQNQWITEMTQYNRMINNRTYL